jgi:WhiB family transcriptional regulator, redox-sensing transcriptional regulator
MRFPDLTRGLCREVGIEFFFPEEGGSGTDIYNLSRRICDSCMVKNKCLEWAVRHESFGMWGGTTPLERKKLRRKRKIILQEILVKDYT